MKLLTKSIEKRLQNQFSKGSSFNQKVVAKLFNPVGAGTWYLLNQDPNDPDYLWCVADMGYGHEMGSVLLSELKSVTGLFGLGIERDLYFDDKMTVKELYEKLNNGEHV